MRKIVTALLLLSLLFGGCSPETRPEAQAEIEANSDLYTQAPAGKIIPGSCRPGTEIDGELVCLPEQEDVANLPSSFLVEEASIEKALAFQQTTGTEVALEDLETLGRLLAALSPTETSLPLEPDTSGICSGFILYRRDGTHVKMELYGNGILVESDQGQTAYLVEQEPYILMRGHLDLLLEQGNSLASKDFEGIGDN